MCFCLFQVHADALKEHMDMLSDLMMLPWMSLSMTQSLRKNLDEVLDGMSKYYKFLQSQQDRTAESHASTVSVTSLRDNWSCNVIEGTSSPEVPTEYERICEVLTAAEMYKPCSLLDIAPADRFLRRKWIVKLKLPFPVMVYTYRHGNYVGNMTFVWRVPQELTDRNDEANIAAVQAVKPLLPVHSTREMRRDFIMKYAKCTKLKPAILRNMYRFLKDDDSACDSQGEEDAQQRMVDFLLQSDDVELVYDLRKNNGRHKDPKLDPFWEELGRFLQEKGAVQERRQNEFLFMPFAISVQDLLEQIKERLPVATPVPSLSWLKLNFYPSNPYTRTAVNYTGRYEVKRTVQQRLLRAQHEDAGYTGHQYTMMKELAVKLKDNSCFVAVDDKTTVPVGKPNEPISTGVRPHNRGMLASSHQVLAAMDHDYHVAGFIPSVLLKVEIPDDARDSFYHGQVYVTVKDKVFQASSPLRHATEHTEILRIPADDQMTQNEPILFLYSDGGPDHRTNFLSVQLAALALFVALDLDMYVAVRTGPNQSYCNPAERIMSLLNLALQNVALCRDEMDGTREFRMKSLNSLKAVRAACDRDPFLKDALTDSLAPVLQLLKERFSRLKRNDNPVIVQDAAADEAISTMAETLLVIDDTLDCAELSKLKVAKHPRLKSFMDRHCRGRHYTFQVCYYRYNYLHMVTKMFCGSFKKKKKIYIT